MKTRFPHASGSAKNSMDTAQTCYTRPTGGTEDDSPGHLQWQKRGAKVTHEVIVYT
jgi:hypothetical protein